VKQRSGFSMAPDEVRVPISDPNKIEPIDQRSVFERSRLPYQPDWTLVNSPWQKQTIIRLQIKTNQVGSVTPIDPTLGITQYKDILANANAIGHDTSETNARPFVKRTQETRSGEADPTRSMNQCFRAKLMRIGSYPNRISMSLRPLGPMMQSNDANSGAAVPTGAVLQAPRVNTGPPRTNNRSPLQGAAAGLAPVAPPTNSTTQICGAIEQADAV
jgi:hypothetical protein